MLKSLNRFFEYFLLGFPPIFHFFYLRNLNPGIQILHCFLLLISTVLVRKYIIAQAKRHDSNAASIIFYTKIFYGYVILIFLQVAWHYLFLVEYYNSGYRGDIFRTVFTSIHAPIYGLHEKIPLNTILFLCSLGFLAYLFIKKCGENSFCLHKFFFFATFFYLIFTIGFSLTESDSRFLGYGAHYEDFFQDFQHFSEAKDILRSYCQEMNNLSFRGKHYPPGNVFLIAIGSRMNIPLLLKLLCYISPIISMFFIIKLASLLQIKPETGLICALLFICSFGVIAFPSTCTAPLSMANCTILQYYFLKNFAKRRKYGFISISIVFMWSLFCSFIANMMLLFLLFHTGIGWITKKSISWYEVKQWFGIGIVSAMLYLSLLHLTGFDMVDCLLQSLTNNQGEINPYDTVSRYLLRSSGNLLAFFFLPGLPLSLLACQNITFSIKNGKTGIDHYKLSWFTTVIVMAFSGLFFLETERVWLFLFPGLCLVAAGEMEKEKFFTKQSPRKKIIWFCLMLAIAVELSFKHYIP